MSRIISPVDNTGYRSLCGNELFVFDSEVDCRQTWSEQTAECINRVDVEIKGAAAAWQAERSRLEKMI